MELLGEVAGSGYRRPPALVRRSDGQVLQLTPVLYAVLAAIDGERDPAGVALHLLERHQLDVEPADVQHLVDTKLRPLGLLCRPDGSEPEVRRSNPLLALRGRVAVASPARTQALAARFSGLFAAPVVAVVLVAFAAMTGWLLFEEGLAGPTRAALYQPSLLLLVIGLTIASAGFHELGHAAACHRGGAVPGVMGAGLYLIWPAFYTDVSDSYRLDRPGRLRVDAGGLYFNAVFTVGMFAVWAVTGADALLLVVPLELLQMLRQLVPLVRFDGYHLLADLTGVPDLFARVKPTLLGLLPTRWGRPENRVLKPWARAVITLWVLVVVPVLALSLVLMVIAFPRVAATAWDSLGVQTSAVASHWSEGRIARMGLSAFSALAIALPLLSMSYLLLRLARRTATRLWTATEGSSPRRVGLVVLAVAALLGLVSAWWPDGQYEPIRAGERGTLVDGIRALRGEPAARSLPSSDDRSDLVEGTADSAASMEARVADDEAPGAGDRAVRARHTFTPPAPAGAGGNQALAVNYEDGSRLADVSPSLVWETDGDVRNRNQAYSLASCTDCSTLTVAFQVVLVVGDADTVVPINEAVAVNDLCLRCTTHAVAVQTVLSLPEMPDDDTVGRLEAVWDRVEALAAEGSSLTADAAHARLTALEDELVEVLGPEVRRLGSDHDRDEAEDSPPPEDGAGTSTTIAAESDAASGDSPTTTGVASTEPDAVETSSTMADATTTTTSAAPTSEPGAAP